MARVSGRWLFGLYGCNRKANILPPQWALMPVQAWAVSPGPSAMEGVVTFRGRPINGAAIKVCCARAFTSRSSLFAVIAGRIQDGAYQMAPPAGNYFATASFSDPATGATLTDAKPVVLPFEQVARVDFELQPPPESNREVIVTGKMDIVSRVAFGHDWWAHPHFEMKHVHVGPYGKPNSPDADMGKVGHTSTSAQLIDYGSVVLARSSSPELS